MSKISDEERKMKYGRKLEQNGMWKDGRSLKESKCLVCGSKISTGAKFCKKHVEFDRYGEKNPFYGKRHSEKTKETLRRIQKEKTKVHCQVKYKIDGKVYKSGKEAAEAFGLSRGTITYRTKSKNFPEWQYA